MTTSYTVASYLLDRLKEVGVEHVFGVPGDYAFPFLDEIENAPAIKWVGTCNELNAAYAADGYARVRGISALTGSCGVLEMGAAGGIAGAFGEEVPLLLISCFPSAGEMARRSFTHHSFRGRFDQLQSMMAPITASQTMLTAADACEQIDAAIKRCWALKTPVYIQFPRDIQELAAAKPIAPLALAEPQSDPAELQRFLTRALQMLRSAKRPAILIDYPIARLGLTEPVQILSDLTGIPFANTRTGRSGTVDQTRAGYLGLYAAPPMSSQTGLQIDAADALLRICLRHDETNQGSADPAHCTPCMIDLQAASATIAGDVYAPVAARDVLDRLGAELPRTRIAATESSVASAGPFLPRHGVAITQDRLWQAFAAFIKPDDTIVIEYGTAQAVAQITLPVRTRTLMQTNWEAIGYTTPALLGAQIADPDGRFIQLIGDGAFQETAQEISTVIRHGLAPITILLNNSTYEIENLTHKSAPVSKNYNRVHGWDYSRLPGVLGPKDRALGVRAETEDEVCAAFEAAATAQRNGRYSLIEVILAPGDVASALTSFTGPQK
jgi:TPP-dependent 2-oxoacid decarboxylase